MGKVKELYIEELENMSDEERAQHEHAQILNDPGIYPESVHKEPSGNNPRLTRSHNQRIQT